MNTHHIAIVGALTAFAIAAGCYLHAFASEKHKNVLNRSAYGLFIFATFLISHVSISSKIQGLHGITSGFLLVTILAWLTLLAQMFFKMPSAGTFISPIITLILILHLLTAPKHDLAPSPGPNSLLDFHIYASVLGQSFAIFALSIAILLLIQQRAMKKKQLNLLLGSTLSLASLEKTLFLCLWAGFIFLSIGLILGAVFTQFYAETPTEIATKVVWAILVWSWYLLTLLAKNVFKLSTKKIAVMTLVGFGIMALGFFGLTTRK